MKRDLTAEQLAQQVTLSLPLSAVLRLAEIGDDVLVSRGRNGTQQVYTRSPQALPAIGAPFNDGIYAGLTVHDNDPHELVLLPGTFTGPWDKAKAWAGEQGGVLPSRFDALVLFKYLKGEFEERYYWTSEERATDADYAWIQTFSTGSQLSLPKSLVYRCRAVRRVSI